MFRRLASPRLRLLPLLWAFWLVLGILFILLANYRMLRLLDLRDIGPLLLFVSPFAVILGSVHYVVLRLRVKRDERNVCRRELWLVPAIAITIFLILGGLVWRDMRERRLQNDIRGESEEVYGKLAMDGQCDELVRRMEADCERFTRAKQMLDGKFQALSYNHGYSYLYVELHMAWCSTIRLVPYGVQAFLQKAEADYAYGPWQPIAKKVSQSQIPILRALACFMLKDERGFADAAYALADRDPDAIPLVAVASSRGSDPAKCVMSIKRILEYQSSGAYNDMVNSHHDSLAADGLESLLFQNAVKALGAGQMDESVKAQLRGRPWVKYLDAEHRKALGAGE